MGPVLVTGATGFIGQHLVGRLLGDGLSVRVLVRGHVGSLNRYADVEVFRGDVRDSESVRAAVAGVESVIHLAARVHDLVEYGDGGEHDDVDLRGTQNLLVAAGESGVKRFVFLSSLSIYGGRSSAARSEEDNCYPDSAYGRAKLASERCVLDWARRVGAHVCCLRPAMVYGVGCKGNLPRMIRMIDRGLFPPLPNLKNRRSMVHVSDVVDAAVLAATHPAANGQCYIVTDGQPYPTRELYEMICRGLGKPIPRWHVPLGVLKGLARVGDAIGRLRGRRFVFDSNAFEKLTGNAWYSSEKITHELGFRPKVTFEDALPEMIDWYRKTRA